MGKKQVVLSNSALDKYKTCPLLYKFHYLDKIRSKTQSSALLFGGAVDDALNCLLLNRDKFKAHRTFYRKMKPWRSTYNVDFFKKDLDPNSILEQDWVSIDSCENDQQRTHTLAWFSLFRKGQQFIEAFHNEVLPLVKNVVSIQEKVELKNEHGDKIIGFLDCVLEMEDGNIYIVDNKTSSKSYSQKMIDESQQLNLYSFIKKIPKIAYIVMRKDFNSKGILRPIQVLKGHCNNDLQHEILFKFDEVLEQIKSSNFEPTKDKKNCKFQFGKPCIYYDICHNNKTVEECEHLINKGERNE